MFSVREGCVGAPGEQGSRGVGECPAADGEHCVGCELRGVKWWGILRGVGRSRYDAKRWWKRRQDVGVRPLTLGKLGHEKSLDIAHSSIQAG